MIPRTAWVLLVVMLLAACTVAPPGQRGSPDPPASAVGPVPTHGSAPPEPCPEIPTTRPPAEPLPADVDDATRTAIKMRTEYGLRRDIAWVRQVAANPRASTAFGFPLLPQEEQSLFARNELPTPVQAVLADYGHGDQFGGLYIDNALGGVVVVLWTGDVAAHEAAIRPRLPECHPVVFLQVRWSEAELRRWQDRISADWNWMATIPAAPRGVGADIMANVVTVDVSSANPNAAAIIVGHYGAPAGMIRVQSDGTGAALLPWGTVKGRVLLADGRRPGPNDLMVSYGSENDPPGSCGGGDVGYGVPADGAFEYPCQIGRRTIQIQDWIPDGDPHPVVASAVVEVEANGVVTVEIRLPEGFDPAATP